MLVSIARSAMFFSSVAVLATGVLLAGCSRQPSAHEPADEPATDLPVETATLTPSEWVHFVRTGDTQTWQITAPVTTQKRTAYRYITFAPGDTVTISARGCVQIGGRGLTWKRYVDPRGPNSENLYHGLVEIPGVTNGLVRLEDVVDTPLVIPGDTTKSPTDPPYLTLGFHDDFYPDNGYYDKDVGLGCQCQNEGPARVTVTIVHGRRSPSPGPIAIVHRSVQPRAEFQAPLPRPRPPSINVPSCTPPPRPPTRRP